MNKFNDMIAFARVAELGSFTAAAKALAISTSAVTKSVGRLEEELGVQLLHRTTRALHLTESGTVYYERCVKLLNELEEAEAEIREANAAPTGLVRICLPPSFGRTTLVPALGGFFERYPGVKLEVNLKGQTANPLEGGYDLTVHSGRLADSGLINRLLIRGPQKTVASPAYVERYGLPQRPEDLLMHNCIVGGFGPAWSFRAPGGGSEIVKVSGALTTDSGDVLREASVNGIGIAHATWWIFREDLKAGRLVSLLEPYETEADPISVVFPANRRIPAKVRALVDFLLELSRGG
jgi:DNA-binding transcriptional LysR family regulator